MSNNKLRLIHPAQTTPSSDIDSLVRQMIDAVDLQPRAFDRGPAGANPDRKIEALERKVSEIEDWASRVEKWAFDEVQRAQNDLAAAVETLAQYKLRIHELETLASDLAEKLRSAETGSRRPVPIAKESAPPPNAPRPPVPQADAADALHWPLRASRLIGARDFSLEAWTA